MSGDMETVKSLTAKEIKALARPEFAANPSEFYPVSVFEEFGFMRTQCSKCGANYWRHCEARDTCGDSQCVGRYTFVGSKSGIGKDHHVSYEEAWSVFKNSLENADIPHTAIPTASTSARWRADVEYVAAGIYVFQPYCVTGELQPPANPLICPQNCLRFNDLDSIGISSRHYSSFIMQGIQVFNYPDNYVYFKEETVRFNLRYLIDGLKIDPDDITLIEDVWAGGGNMGPCVEYFIGGLEVGNMVFMQFKTFPDGSREELQVKVVDVGIGLERVPWLLNGTPTSYIDTFRGPLEVLQEVTGIPYTNEVWDKFGPLSCRLNVDEVDSMEDTWQGIADELSMDRAELMAAVEPVRDMYIVCDHTRTVLIAVRDGSLPSNVGGASNLRGVLRRVFSLLHKNGWWEKLQMDGLMRLFEAHLDLLSRIHGPAFAKDYPSFRTIIEIEYQRWLTSDADARSKLDKLVKKRKGKLTLDDWIMCVTSYGLDPEKIAELTGATAPGSLYYEIATREEKVVKQAAKQLYDTAHLPETGELFYAKETELAMTSKVVDVIENVEQENKLNIIVLDETSFYPTSGGQEHDTGALTIEGVEYKVVNVIKVGRVIFHVLDRAIEAAKKEDLIGKAAAGVVDEPRRRQLRCHHSAAHVVSAACRKVLGPHVWQAGANKTVERASLDITHHSSLTHEEVVAIETAANRIVSECHPVAKFTMGKEAAEKKYGFELYQGGIVPGNEVRVVDIGHGTDTEACCGTHVDSTGELGQIRVTKTKRISDGIVRLYFVAADRAVQETLEQAELLYQLQESWGVSQEGILPSADKFFTNHKLYKKQCDKYFSTLMRSFVLDEATNVFVKSDFPDLSVFTSGGARHLQGMVEKKKNIVFVGPSYLYGLLSDGSSFDHKTILEPVLAKMDEIKKKKVEADAVAVADAEEGGKKAGKKKPILMSRANISFSGVDEKGKKKKITIPTAVEFSSLSVTDSAPLVKVLQEAGFVEFN